MDWLRSLVKDESLKDDISYFPTRKYLYDASISDRLYDEPVCSNAWWDVQVSIIWYLLYDAANIDTRQCQMIQDEMLVKCWMPFHLWLDKGNVTRRLQMHPLVIRALFLPSFIRNASGNGGGILISFTPIVIISYQIFERLFQKHTKSSATDQGATRSEQRRHRGVASVQT